MNLKDASMMQVEVWSDILCPFCFIGKRKFEAALAQFAEKDKIKLVWKSFQLDPSLGENEAIAYHQHLQNKKGWTAAQTADIINHVSQRAEEVGIHFALEKAIMANSLKAHCLSHYALEQDKQNEIEEALFSAHFSEGKNIADPEILGEIAASVGLSYNEAINAINDPKYINLAATDIQEAQQLGISGVPFFVFDRKYAVSGAQEPSLFLQTMEKAFADWLAKNKTEFILDTDGPMCKPDGTCD